MSARVLNPIVFAEFCKLTASPATRHLQRNLPCKSSQSVKRDLFGSSPSKETDKLFDEEIKQHQDIAARRWGFDFRNGIPASTSESYSWERVVVPEVAPEMYTLTRAAHIRSIIPYTPTEQEILLDERSSKENILDEMISYPFKTPSPVRQSTSTSPSKIILACHTSLGKRQPRITEYMKERKRLSQTPKKVSPSKRQRTSSGSHHSSLNMFVTSRK